MLHFAIRELQAYLTNKRVITILLGIIVICVISGPFSTLHLSVVARAFYWGFTIIGAAVISRVTFAVVKKTLQRYSTGIIYTLLACNLASALLVGLFLYTTTRIIWGMDSPAPGLLALISTTFIISTFITLLIWFNQDYDKADRAENVDKDCGDGNAKIATSTQYKTNALFERLPKALGNDVISLSSQDHYLEVVTALGKELILMRLGDAIQALPEGQGLQIHRSHWVAKSAIVGLERNGGKWLLALKNNTQLPVSRNYRDDVKTLNL